MYNLRLSGWFLPEYLCLASVWLDSSNWKTNLVLFIDLSIYFLMKAKSAWIVGG